MRLGCPSFRLAAVCFLAVLLSGPLLWYATSSFGEMLAALVTTALVAACLRRAGGPVVGLLLVLAGLSKDTALPFLVLLGLGSSLLNPGWAERGFRTYCVRNTPPNSSKAARSILSILSCLEAHETLWRPKGMRPIPMLLARSLSSTSSQ